MPISPTLSNCLIYQLRTYRGFFLGLKLSDYLAYKEDSIKNFNVFKFNILNFQFYYITHLQ